VIVVDTNVIAYSLIEGDRTPQAQALWQRDSRWCLPSLWRYEFLNVLSAYVRAGGMELSDATRLWHSAGRLYTPMENGVDMNAVLELSVEKEISTYDAQFVFLAHSLGVPLISEDKQLRRRCPETVVSMDDYLKE
jgi:predicted nucleic acid-binding protein